MTEGAAGGTSPPLDTAFARAHFPALAGPWALFENAGGTLAAAQVLDRIRTYMAEYQVQPGAAYPASARAAEMIAESHRAMAAMINAEPEEVMIGPSTSMNVFSSPRRSGPASARATRSSSPISTTRRTSAPGASSRQMASRCASGASTRRALRWSRRGSRRC